MNNKGILNVCVITETSVKQEVFVENTWLPVQQKQYKVSFIICHIQNQAQYRCAVKAVSMLSMVQV